MSFIGVINSDPETKESIDFAFSQNQKYEIKYLIEEDAILEFLNYELPEIVIINFSDPVIKIDEITSHIKNDKWILNFGIIGLYSHKRNKEEELLKKYKDINVLTLLDNYRLRSHLVKNLQIIEENYQIIFQREFTKNLLDGASGGFTIDNDLLAVPLYAAIGATILVQRGLINPDSKMHLQMALSELIVNAIEHGSCGISYDEKTEAMNQGLSVVDLVMEKCKDPAVMAKKVDLQWEIQKDRSIFIVRDEGKGFDVKAHLRKIANQDQMSLHGRGIKMAALFSHELKYNSIGNRVALILHHDSSVEHEIPLGFSKEQVLLVKPGEIVIKEGEPSDNLYYISSGKYSVFHNQKQVGSLSPQDIFMGEMSFLLSQKRSASIRADTQGKLIFLPRRNFISVIREYPHYGIFLSKLLAKRLSRSNDQNALLMSRIKSENLPVPPEDSNLL
jgi:anti-sigma regulatory factor (Ser/Thr protein kinase)